MRLRLRAVEGPGKVAARFLKPAAPFTHSLMEEVTAGREWAEFSCMFFAREDIPAGVAQLQFSCAESAQMVEFTDIRRINHGQIDAAKLGLRNATFLK